MTRPILYSSVRSPHCLKVAMFLEEKGVDFDRVEIDLPAKEQKTSTYLAINPLGLVPSFEDDYGPRQDSLLIMHYIEWRYPEPKLFPPDNQLAEAMDWVEKSGSAYRDVSHHLYWQLIEPPETGTDHERVKELMDEGIRLLRQLEDLLVDKDYLFGDFGLVDIAFIPWIYGYNRFEGLLSKERNPRLVNWVNRVATRNSFRNNHNQKGRSFNPGDIGT